MLVNVSPFCSPKTITTTCLPPHSDSVFVGTLGGITYPIDVHLYGMSPEIIAPSRARERLNYRGDREPGAVQCLEVNPTQKRQVRAVCTRACLSASNWVIGETKRVHLEDIILVQDSSSSRSRCVFRCPPENSSLNTGELIAVTSPLPTLHLCCEQVILSFLSF